MYSYSDENFVMNSYYDYDKYLYNINQLNNGSFGGIVELSDLTNFLAALDDYVIQNPQQINMVMSFLDEVVKNPQKHLTSDVANQHIEAAPRILMRKKIQYGFMRDGKEYEANTASLVAQEIFLTASHDVALEMGLDDVVENIEHDMTLIDMRKKIEFAKYKSSTDAQWQQKLETLQSEYEEATVSKKR